MTQPLRFPSALVMMIGMAASQLACFSTAPPPPPPVVGVPESSSSEGESETENETEVAEATTPAVRPRASQKKAEDGDIAFRVPTQWSVTPDPSDQPAEIKTPADAPVAIAVPSGVGALFPTTPSAFVAVGQNQAATDVREVWDLRTMARTGSIKGQVEASDKSPSALSPDGQFLVAEVKPAGTIEVWSFQTGALVRRIDLRPTPTELDFLDFAAPGQVIVGIKLKESSLFQVLNFQDGPLLARGFEAPPKYAEGSATLSPGRKTLAVAANDVMVVYDLASGLPVGAQGLPGPNPRIALRFSPDGKELAALSVSDQFLVWDVAKGEQTTALALPKSLLLKSDAIYIHKGPQVEWLPDASAWLLRGFEVVDRESGLMVWTIRPASGQIMQGPRRFLDNDRLLLVSGPRGAPRLEALAMPWPQIDATIKAMRSDTPAYLRPGQEVSVQVEVAGVRFSNPDQTKSELVEAVGALLAAQGMKVAEGQPTVLHLRHNETPGRTVTYRKFGGLGVADSQINVQSTTFTGEFALKAAGQAQPLWTYKEETVGSLSYFTSGEISDTSTRNSSFKGYKDSIKDLPIPQFIPKDPQAFRLPGTTILTPVAAGRINRVGPSRPTLRGQR